MWAVRAVDVVRTSGAYRCKCRRCIVRNGVMHAKLQSTPIYSSDSMCELSLRFTLIIHYVPLTMLLALMTTYLVICSSLQL